MDQLDAVVNISLDLSAGLSAADRNRRLLESLRRVIPFDAATLMRLEGGDLLPVAEACAFLLDHAGVVLAVMLLAGVESLGASGVAPGVVVDVRNHPVAAGVALWAAFCEGWP